MCPTYEKYQYVARDQTTILVWRLHNCRTSIPKNIQNVVLIIIGVIQVLLVLVIWQIEKEF